MSAFEITCEKCGAVYLGGMVGSTPWPRHVCSPGGGEASIRTAQAEPLDDKLKREWGEMLGEITRLRAGLLACATAAGEDVSDGIPTWPDVVDWAVRAVRECRETEEEGYEQLRAAGEELHLGLRVMLRGHEHEEREDLEAREVHSEIRESLLVWRRLVPGKPLWFDQASSRLQSERETDR